MMKRNLLLLVTLLMVSFSQPTNPSAASPDTVTTLVNAACDQPLVLLGELPSHGEAKTFQLKAQVVQQLVERCGFGLLFFEAPVYEFVGLQTALDQQQANLKLLNNALGGFWSNHELATWRQWLLTSAQQQKLQLRGLDDQLSRSSEHARLVLPELAKESGEQGAACATAITRNLFWQYNEATPYDQAEKDFLLQCAKSAHEHHQSQPAQLFMANLHNLYARQAGQAAALSRDAMMLNNFLWQQPDSEKPIKSIIWTATVHAAKQQGPLKTKPLGQLLQEQTKIPFTAVGFTAYSGQSLMAGTMRQSFAPAPPGTLEHQIKQHPELESLHLTPTGLKSLGSVSARLFGAFETLEWHRYFDHIVVIEQEVEPTFD